MADDQNDAGTSSEEARGLRAQLEAAKAEAAAAKAEAESIKQQAAREQAFAKAGIPDSKLGEMFRKSYDGELSADAIKANALELGLIQQQTTTPPEEREQLLSLQEDRFTPNRIDDTNAKAIESTIAELAKQPGGSDKIAELLHRHGLDGG